MVEKLKTALNYEKEIKRHHLVLQNDQGNFLVMPLRNISVLSLVPMNMLSIQYLDIFRHK